MLLFLMFKMIEGFADVVNDFLGWDSLRLATIKVCLFLFGTIYYFFGMNYVGIVYIIKFLFFTFCLKCGFI